MDEDAESEDVRSLPLRSSSPCMEEDRADGAPGIHVLRSLSELSVPVSKLSEKRGKFCLLLQNDPAQTPLRHTLTYLHTYLLYLLSSEHLSVEVLFLP
jgi:hypothetical protein